MNTLKGKTTEKLFLHCFHLPTMENISESLNRRLEQILSNLFTASSFSHYFVFPFQRAHHFSPTTETFPSLLVHFYVQMFIIELVCFILWTWGLRNKSSLGACFLHRFSDKRAIIMLKVQLSTSFFFLSWTFSERYKFNCDSNHEEADLTGLVWTINGEKNLRHHQVISIARSSFPLVFHRPRRKENFIAF